jgi:hypothetical protein
MQITGRYTANRGVDSTPQRIVGVFSTSPGPTIDAILVRGTSVTIDFIGANPPGRTKAMAELGPATPIL